MANLIGDASCILDTAPIGEFSIDKKSAASCFTYPVQTTPSAHKFNVDLNLIYNSQTNGDFFLGGGWCLGGCEAVYEVAPGIFYQNGEQCEPVVIKKDEICFFDSDGIKSTYKHQAKARYQLVRLEDVYKNICFIDYDSKGRPTSIDYGTVMHLSGGVRFRYDNTAEKLATITSYLAQQVCFETRLSYENDTLQSITAVAFREGVCYERKPIQFSYHPKTLLISKVWYRNDGDITVNYQQGSAAVSTYEEVTRPFRGRKIVDKFDVFSNGWIEPQFNYPFFETVTVWSRTAHIGSTWNYYADPEYQGLLRAEIFGKKLDANGSVISLKESFYTYQYLPKTVTPVISQITSLDYSSPAVGAIKAVEIFEYDARGSLICASDGQTMTLKRYQYTPFPFETALLTSKVLYDVTNSATLSDDQILRAEKFGYQIEEGTGAVRKIAHEVAIDVNNYANPLITKRDPQGRDKWICKPNGTYHHYEYDALGFRQKETICTEDKSKSIVNSFQYCPLSGNLLKEINWKGAIKEQTYDAVGELVAQCQSTVGNNKDRILLLQQNLRWDNQLNVYISEVQKPVGNTTLKGLELNLFDGLMRPLANAIEIEADRWQVELVTYCSRTKQVAQSLPFEVGSSLSELPFKLKRKSATKIRWIRTYFDEMGRTVLIKQPDGSRKVTQYFTRKCGTAFEEEKTYDASGKFVRAEQRAMSKDGQLTERLLGESDVSCFRYNLLGQLTSKVTAKNETYVYEWDLLGNCMSESHPILGTTTQTMGSDLQIYRQHKDECIFNFERDWLGRIVRCFSENTNNEICEQLLSYKIDPDTGHNVTTFRDNQGVEIETGYSPFGVEVSRRMRVRDREFSPLRTTYWPNAQVRSRLYPDGRALNYTYDPRGFLKSVTQVGQDQPIVSYEGYDFQGQAGKAVFANGITETKTRDAMGRIKSFDVRASFQGSNEKALLSQNFAYMQGYPAALAAKHEDADQAKPRSTFFHYDNLERLSNVKATSTDIGPRADEKMRGSGDCYVEMGPKGLAQSLQRQDQAFDFEHDILGRLQVAQGQVKGMHTQIEYLYFPDGKLLQSKCENGVVTTFFDRDYQHEVYPNGEECSVLKVLGDRGVIAELTNFISDTKQIPPSPLKSMGKLEFVHKKSGEIFIHLDLQASSVLATNSEGLRVANLSFSPFGEIDHQNSGGSVGFDVVYAGMRFDPVLELFVSDARIYCAETKQFLSPDPMRATSDLWAYPSDPINYEDASGLCPMPNYYRAFTDNYGRPLNLKGSVAATAINCFSVFLPVYLLVFGYDLPASLRWTIGLGAWFLTASLLGSICVHVNRSYGGQPEVPSTHSCGRGGMVLTKTLVSTGIAVVYLGPMLSFIGNDDCEPYELLNCSPEFYRINLIRGLLATSIATPLGLVMSGFLQGTSFRNRSLANRYVTNVVSLWFSYGIWQFFDILQLRILFGRNPVDVLHFKRAFLSGEIFLGLLMAQPNPVWGLLPALFHCRGWNYFFSNRPETERGEIIPWFASANEIAPVVGLPAPIRSDVQLEIIEIDVNGSDTEGDTQSETDSVSISTTDSRSMRLDVEPEE